jgi:hypothetical protein
MASLSRAETLTVKAGLACSSNSGNAALVDGSIVLEAHVHISGGTVDLAMVVWILSKMNAMPGAIVVMTDFDLPVSYDLCTSASTPLSSTAVTLSFTWGDAFGKSMKKTRMRLEILIYGIFADRSEF